MKTKLTKNQEEYIVKEYDSGKGKFAKELGRELGVNHQVITNCLRRNGVRVVKRWAKNTGSKNGRWKNGKRMIKGYLHILNPDHHLARKDGYVPVHRINAEKKIGRKLKNGEVIHHIDGNILNNNQNNLIVFKNNGEHIKHHGFSRDRFGRFSKN